MIRRTSGWALQLITLLSLVGCGGGDESTPGVSLKPDTCKDVVVDRFKELTIVEPSVVDDARARNDSGGPWSFRHLVEEMVPPGVSTSDFMLSWLQSFEQVSRVNQFEVPAREQAAELLRCSWLRSTPENECNAGCLSCANYTLDLAKAPFRLIGFANRVDLHATEDLGNAGESRLVFAATRGPGDNPASQPLQMTVIFEYRNPSDQGRTASYWAERWHALGVHKAYDEAFMADLAALYAEITSRPADGKPSWIHQVRTNEISLDWVWDLREFKLINGGLRLAPTLRTPDRSLNGSEELAKFVRSNREAILAGNYQFPEYLEGGFARPTAPWTMPGVDIELRSAFARSTCDGCHQTEADSLDENFHVSPLRVGRDRLSKFLNNPADPSNDELSRREQVMRNLVCGNDSPTGEYK